MTDWTPIDHHPVYRRIDLYGPKPEEPKRVCSYPYCSCDPRCFTSEKQYAVSEEEAARIWQLVVSTARGTNMPMNHRASEVASEANGHPAEEKVAAEPSYTFLAPWQIAGEQWTVEEAIELNRVLNPLVSDDVRREK